VERSTGGGFDIGLGGDAAEEDIMFNA